MRNINELIGIIKGINFDGVINDKEVVKLQSWVDKNRNLAYEPRQIEIIGVVDSVLEDSIVTDDERELMLAYSERFLIEMNDDTAKIYELNGIVEGIICDGEVNEAEVYRLKVWMSNYGDEIRGHKPSEELCKVVDSILEDGIVTEEEQSQLLRMLSIRISGSQFEIKLGYLRKQLKARKNICIDLIDMLDNEDAMAEIHQRAEVQLRNTLNSYSGTHVMDPEVVFISLCLIAMLEYDGAYYEKVRKTYMDLYCRYSEQRVEGLIRTILNRYRSEEESRDSKSRIINVVLLNAIVPSNFLAAFFEFIYDIYKLNFEYDLPDDLYEEFKFVYEGLRSSMMSDGDDIQVNVTKKTYKLIKTTKQLIVNEKYIDAVIKLSIIIVNLIDKRMWNKEIKIFNPYLKRGYEGWVSTFKDEKKTTHHRIKSEFRSRWEPKYLLLQNQVYIVPPIHRTKADYNYWDIRVVVKNGEQEIYVNNEPDIREIIGGYQVSINKIRIDNPIGKITYQLLAKGEVIYDSREKLYRSFLVFDHDGGEINNNTDYSGTAVFCIDNHEKALKPFYKVENYALAAENVRLGSTYLLGDTVFNFSSLIKPGVFGEKWPSHNIVDYISGENITVFKSVKFLTFEADSKSYRFEIILDGKNRKLEDLSYSITEREGVNKYIIDLDIPECGIHTVEVNSWDDGKKNRILPLLTFVLDKKLDAESIKLDDETYMVSITSGLFPFTINEEINVADFEEDLISFEYLGKKYIYHIPFEFDIYRIGGMSWKPTSEEMWVGDISQDSVLDIYGTDIDELHVYASTGEAIDEVLKLKDRGVYQQVPVGFLASYKVSYDYLMLLFLKGGKKQKAIFCYNKCILDDEGTELIYDSVTKSLDIIPRFYGKGNVYFSITDKRGDEFYRSTYLQNSVLERTSNLASFEKYKITFYEKEKGLSLKKERILKEYERMLYAREDFVGRSFKIKEVYFDQFVRGEFLRKRHYFNHIYLYFLEKVSDDLYTGEIYVRTYNGSFMLDNLNSVDIEICSDVIDGTMELAITKDGDGLLLDFEHHGIMNTLDDDFAVDIFSYIMDMNGVEAF